jgi:hypothetical protein
VDETALTSGERQLCLVLVARGLAAPTVPDGQRAYLLDAGFHQRLVESLAARGVALQAAGSEASALS